MEVLNIRIVYRSRNSYNFEISLQLQPFFPLNNNRARLTDKKIKYIFLSTIVSGYLADFYIALAPFDCEILPQNVGPKQYAQVAKPPKQIRTVSHQQWRQRLSAPFGIHKQC